MEQLKLIVRQLKPRASNFGSKLSSTTAMICIIAVVLAATVVKKGKKPDNRHNRPSAGC
jgi:hypothetical protein